MENMYEEDRYSNNDGTQSWVILVDSEDNHYRCRVQTDVDDCPVYISSESLLNDLRDENGYRDIIPTAEEVDNSICFFVNDDVFHNATDGELRDILTRDNPDMFIEYDR